MKRLVVLLALVAVVWVPPAAAINVEVAITSPGAGTHSLAGNVPVIINASSDVGIYGVQLQVDHKYYGVINMVPFAPYTYEIDVNASALTVGDHTLTAIATDWSQLGGGHKWASDDVTVDVGPAYPTIAITAPAANSIVHGTVPVTEATTSAVAPASVSISVDAVPLASSTWDTSTVADGPHTITGTIVDGRGKTATASSTVTVDNTPPSTAITVPAAGSFALDTLAVQASASDPSGVASVQFSIDGIATGAPVTTPDAGASTYSTTLSLAGLSNGTHTVQSTATDGVGNSGTSTAVSFTIGAGPPTIVVTVPPDWTYAHGNVQVTAAVSGGTLPDSVRLVVDGTPVGAALTSAPYTFTWDTTLLPDGAHTLAATVTDALNRTSTSPVIHQTVDNTPPVTLVTAPAPNSYALNTLPVQAHASDNFGVAKVQFAIDGTPSGSPVTVPDTLGGFTYSTILDLTGLPGGTHTLTSVATDNAGLTTTSSPVTFVIGVPPGVVTVTSPTDWTFLHGIFPVTATIVGGTPPFTAQLVVDGVASSAVPTVNGSSFTIPWSTTGAIDGSHTVSVAVKSADGITVYSPLVNVTVDNFAPTAVMYLPTPLPGYSYARVAGTTQLQVHASDAFGIKSVQFTVDGSPVGSPLTTPDAGQQYLYSASYDTSALAAGLHSVSAIVTDAAGNITTAAPLSMKTGPLAYVPVLNYHGITGTLDTNPDVYDETPAQADAELAYLKANGYQSITVEQYQTWLATGALPAGVSKPILITVDDGLTDELAWDPLLQKYGFKAVLYVVTGFADNTTPGANDPVGNMSWAQIQALAKNGRWQIAFHAGLDGHADFSDAISIPLGTGVTQSYSSTCWTYYGCLGTIKTVTGSGRTAKTTTAPETPAQFETQVAAEVTNGLTELKQKVPTASLISFACPWNACGQWTNFYNDPSGTVQAWMPGYFASKFGIVFTQTNPITYGLASGTVGALNGFNRHYRFEVHTDTTIDQFAASLADPAFANN
jgi:hypothetical protein